MPDDPSQLRIMPLSNNQVCDNFDCGDPGVNAALVQAANNSQNLISTSFVTATDDKNIIFGFYSVTATNIEFKEIPENLADKIGSYPIPAVIIERIGVHNSFQRKGLGARLLIDALQRIYNATDEIDAGVIMVEAGNERLRAFYLHYGFIPLTGSVSRLFLPMEKVVKLFEEITP